MNITSNSGEHKLENTRVVEIIGPAGVGKTTLCQTLLCRTEYARFDNFPDVRKAADAPFFILNGLQLIPTLFRLYRPNSRHLTRREFAWVSILNGWSVLLRKELNNGNKITVLDQGPIYLLAEMRLFGPEYLKQTTAERFWQDLYDYWSATLNMVIWLDAANDVLLDRIRTRQQEHIMKTRPAQEIYAFLNSYRTEYEFILSNLIAKKTGLKVFRFDTGRLQPQDIENQFWSELAC